MGSYTPGMNQYPPGAYPGAANGPPGYIPQQIPPGAPPGYYNPQMYALQRNNLPQRGRPRPRPRQIREYDEESDEDFVPQTGPLPDTRRRARVHRTGSNYNEDSESEGQNDEAEETIEPAIETHTGEGPLFDLFLGKVNDENKPQYLIKWTHSSYIHSTIISEAEIRSGSRTNEKLKEYNGLIDKTGEQISEISGEIVEPPVAPIEKSIFFIDRIIDHRSNSSRTALSVDVSDTDHYTAGIPCDILPPIGHLDKFDNPFLDPTEHPELPMDDIGTFTLSIVAPNKEPTQQEKKEVIDQNPPMNAEYLVKWRDAYECDSTWERIPYLRGTAPDQVLCPANSLALDELLSQYWKRITVRTFPPPRELNTDFNVLGRLKSLTDDQVKYIKEIVEAKKKHSNIVLKGEEGSGRIVTVVSFLDILYTQFLIHQPSLIIVDKNYIKVWQQALREFSSLYWAEYNGTVSNRLIIRHHELNPEKRKFDVLIIDKDIMNKEQELIREIPWGQIIVDQEHGATNISDFILKRSVFKIIISSSKSEFEIPNTFIELHTKPLWGIKFNETIHFVQNCVSSAIHTRLKNIFKSKGSRSGAVRESNRLLREVYKCHIHPFLVPEIQKQLTMEYKNRLGMSNNSVLSLNDQINIILNMSGKLQKLVQLVDRESLTAVIADQFSTLRMIQKILVHEEIPNGLLESTIPNEVISTSISNGVILMTRDFSSPLLDFLPINKIIFFDVGTDHDKDINLVRFMLRNGEIPIHRLMVYDSVEVSIFYDSLTHQHFNLETLSPIQSEEYLRIAAYTTQPNRKKAELLEYNFEYPNSISDFMDNVGTFDSDVLMNEEFWDTIFANYRSGHIKQSSWKNKDALNYMGLMMQYGIGQWEKIAEVMGRPLDEVSTFGHAILLLLISLLSPEELIEHNLLNAVLWFELFPAPFENQFIETPDFWKNVAFEDSTLSHSVFINSHFSKQLHSRRDDYLEELKAKWVVQAYLSFRSRPYLPFRFMIQYDAPRTDPDFYFKLMEFYVDNGAKWNSFISQNSINAKEEDIKKIFQSLYKAIMMDIMSVVLHHRAPDDELRNNKFLRPFYQVSEVGPYSYLWDDKEVKCIITGLIDFSIPLVSAKEKDWYEFHSVTRLLSKSTQMVINFTERLIFVFSKSKVQQFVFLENRVEYLKTRISSLEEDTVKTCEHPTQIPGKGIITIKSRLQFFYHIRLTVFDGLKEFRRQIGLPDGWDIKCDMALFEGICQYGFDRFQELMKAVKRDIAEHHDHVMNQSLSRFYEGSMSLNQFYIQRIKFMVIINRNFPRHLKLVNTDIKKIQLKMTIPRPAKTDDKNSQQQQQQQQQQRKAASQQRGHTILPKWDPKRRGGEQWETYSARYAIQNPLPTASQQPPQQLRQLPPKPTPPPPPPPQPPSPPTPHRQPRQRQIYSPDEPPSRYQQPIHQPPPPPIHQPPPPPPPQSTTSKKEQGIHKNVQAPIFDENVLDLFENFKKKDDTSSTSPVFNRPDTTPSPTPPVLTPVETEPIMERKTTSIRQQRRPPRQPNPSEMMESPLGPTSPSPPPAPTNLLGSSSIPPSSSSSLSQRSGQDQKMGMMQNSSYNQQSYQMNQQQQQQQQQQSSIFNVNSSDVQFIQQFQSNMGYQQQQQQQQQQMQYMSKKEPPVSSPSNSQLSAQMSANDLMNEKNKQRKFRQARQTNPPISNRISSNGSSSMIPTPQLQGGGQYMPPYGQYNQYGVPQFGQYGYGMGYPGMPFGYPQMYGQQYGANYYQQMQNMQNMGEQQQVYNMQQESQSQMSQQYNQSQYNASSSAAPPKPSVPEVPRQTPEKESTIIDLKKGARRSSTSSQQSSQVSRMPMPMPIQIDEYSSQGAKNKSQEKPKPQARNRMPDHDRPSLRELSFTFPTLPQRINFVS